MESPSPSPVITQTESSGLTHLRPVAIVGAPPPDVPAAQAPPGFRMIGLAGDATGEVSLTLSRGARLLFANAADSGSQSYAIIVNDVTFGGELPVCPEQCSLDFSSELLPDRFTVTLTDRGAAPGDWFAVGLARTD